MAVDLLFKGAPLTGHPVNLVFGQGDDPPPATDATVTLVGRLPGLSGTIPLAPGVTTTLHATLPGLTGTIGIRYNTDTSRPVVNETDMRWQEGVDIATGVEAVWQDSQRLPVGVDTRWQDAVRLHHGVRQRWEDSLRLRRGAEVRFQEAIRLGTPETGMRFQDGVRLRASREVRFQEAIRTSLPPLAVRYQDGLRDRRNWAAVRYQEAVPLSVETTSVEQRAVALDRLWDVRYQEAMRPPAGVWIRPVDPEPGDTCYTPPDGDKVHLLFKAPWSSDTNLLFVCEKHGPGPEPGDTVVVPIKEVYLVINSAVLIRVSNGKAIPTLAMSMSLDVDSWTWSFSAAVPTRALADLEPEDGVPVDVQATINGVPYRFIVEAISRERAFNQDSLRVGGRGRSAVLDTPYAPTMSFMNQNDRTAQQLLADILTDNGVPLGWDVEWGPTDWLVPAGVFSHQGSYVSAINQAVGSIGAYLQPHNTGEVLRVLSRYPSAPWQWGSVTPDYEIPAAVATREGIDWVSKPVYNRVYVAGQQNGVLGRVTRTGTAGDLLAPQVVDPLITHADAARQRGTAILSDTGRIASVSLRMPVLSETGIIPPGKFVRYVDGGVTRLGITRSVQVEVGLPAIWQTIGVETHVD